STPRSRAATGSCRAWARAALAARSRGRSTWVAAVGAVGCGCEVVTPATAASASVAPTPIHVLLFIAGPPAFTIPAVGEQCEMRYGPGALLGPDLTGAHLLHDVEHRHAGVGGRRPDRAARLDDP